MRKILMFICLIVSVQMLGQVPNPTNYSFINGRYRWLGGMFDSGLHVPRYNGVPSGLRSGISIADGLIAMDTTNGSFYGYRNSAWFRIANYSDLSTVTNTDSLFGNQDNLPAENRSVDFTSTYTMGLRHLSSSTFDADSSVSSVGYAFMTLGKFSNRARLGTSYRSLTTNQGASLFESDWNSGNPYAQIVSWKNGSSSLSNYFRTYTDSLSIFLSAGSSLKAHNIPSGSAANVLHYDPSTGDITYDAGGGGGISAADLPLRITGSTVSADTSVAYNPSLMTNASRQKLLDSLQAAGWGNQSVNSDYRYYVDMSGSTFANGFFTGTGAGASAIIINSAIDGWFYGRDLQTGTTTTGRAYSLSQTGAYNIIAINTAFRYSAGTKIRLEDLSDGTETFGVMFGFMDDVNAYSSVVDGFGFRYTHSDSSGTFIMWTKSNSTITEDATDITVAADTDYMLQTYCIGGVAYFYINGVLKGSIGTNVPNGTARATSLGMSIFKSAGTTSRHMYVNTFGYDWRDN